MKPRFRRLAYAGAATVGAALTALVLAGGPTTASADQCESARGTSTAIQPLAPKCVTDVQAAGAAMEGRPGSRVAETPNEASPAPEENAGGAVQPGASTGPEVPETPESNPVQPQASTPPEVPETTPPEEETGTQPVVPTDSPSPSEETGTQPAVPAESPSPSEEAGTQPAMPENQPELPVTGRDDGPKIAGLGAGILAAGAALVAATRRRRAAHSDRP